MQLTYRELATLRARIERLEALVTELADELEAEIKGRYGETIFTYPSEQRRYERDMKPVRQARAYLAGKEGA